MEADPDYSNPFDRGPICNYPGKFLCPICRSEAYHGVMSYTRDGRSKLTSLFQCRGCTALFANPEAFTARRRFVLQKAFNCDVYTVVQVKPYDPEEPDGGSRQE